MNFHEVVVIGGGPAGAAAAIQLARAGQPVTLLEREKGPHDKVCGEFISWEATHYLRLLGIDLPALGAHPIRRVRLCAGNDRSETALPFTAWSLSRRRLDMALLDSAERAGADVRRGVAARSMEQRGERWVLHTDKSVLEASTVFLASGKRDLRQWRRPVDRESRQLIGLKMHLRLDRSQHQELRNTVEVYLYDGGYAGLEPVEGTKANLCFLIHKDIYKACDRNWSLTLQWLRHTSPHLDRRLSGCTSLWGRPLAVSGTPYGFLQPVAANPAGLFRLGDQTAVIPSFAGDGMAMALHSASIASRTYLRGADARQYQQLARQAFRGPVHRARLIAGFLSHPRARRAALALARAWPTAMEKAISQTRLNEKQLEVLGSPIPEAL